jgi:hypothetical protein
MSNHGTSDFHFNAYKESDTASRALQSSNFFEHVAIWKRSVNGPLPPCGKNTDTQMTGDGFALTKLKFEPGRKTCRVKLTQRRF